MEMGITEHGIPPVRSDHSNSFEMCLYARRRSCIWDAGMIDQERLVLDGGIGDMTMARYLVARDLEG
jgi:hypothetical protein